MKPPQYILPVIVFSQFCGTSLWFSSNAVMPNLLNDFTLNEIALAHLTAAVQLGFIGGTLVFAILSIADRFSPSRVFVISAILGALCNLAIIWDGNTLSSLLGFRSMTGFFLAGIYPVGMKIASDYYDQGLGRSLGFLVGALVLGTAFPHLLKDLLVGFPWKQIILATSLLAAIGGITLVLFVPNGPFRKEGSKLSINQITEIFIEPEFRKAAIGYFGHMWELYAFWAIVPVILISYNTLFPSTQIAVGFYSFIIIGIGALGCVLGGILSEIFGVQKMAKRFLWFSAICCLVSPLVLSISYSGIVITFLSLWGIVVIADSPLFSTLVAQRSAPSVKGTAITIVTCIGFAITILSIQSLLLLKEYVPIIYILPLLAIGPLYSLFITRD